MDKSEGKEVKKTVKHPRVQFPRPVIAICVIVPICIALLVGYSLAIRYKNPSDDVRDHGKSILSTTYKELDGKVYLLLGPENEEDTLGWYYPVVGADSRSFHPFTTPDGSLSFVSTDKSHVFCGHAVVPGAKPASLQYIGNNHYTDGTETFFCASRPTRNPDSGDYTLNSALYVLGLRAFEPYYHYEMDVLPKSSTPYEAIAKGDVVTNGTTIYYQGKPLDGVNKDHFQPIAFREDTPPSVIDDYIYFTDGSHIYYGNKKLDYPYNDQMRAYDVEGAPAIFFLEDPTKHALFANGKEIRPQSEPFYPITIKGRRSHHILLDGKDGLYYYDRSNGNVGKLAEKPLFSGQFKEIAPLLYSNGKDVYYIDSDTTSGYVPYSNRKSVKGYRTNVVQLLKTSPEEWFLQGKVGDGQGAIYRNSNDLYYVDFAGPITTVPSTVYTLDLDKHLVSKLTESTTTAEDIAKAIDAGQLRLPKQTIKYDVETSDSSWLILFLSVGVFLLIAFYINKQLVAYYSKQPIFKIRRNRLIIRDAWRKKYPLNDIKEVRFYVTNFVEDGEIVTNVRVVNQKGEESKPVKVKCYAKTIFYRLENVFAFLNLSIDRLNEASIPSRVFLNGDEVDPKNPPQGPHQTQKSSS